MRTPTRPSTRSAPRSPARSAGARATRTSSQRSSGRPSTTPRPDRRHEMAVTENRPIGFGPLKRKEDARFIRGQGTYLDDIRLPGMLHGAVLRSPFAHARIVSIDTSEALAHPNVAAVITAKDLET